ncbi:tumor necrosis factor receptor superfamily member 16-like [Daphnia pulex]|uniref:tumor necrosis factor receptor superfamily member 16-like n=1 Tax=Daphnia pulex TaxID=6669 RepID=UPI001EE028D2|nr:tumor necrosis factor receptor superfamily member 16-like [Daphnia pulex]
MNDMMETCFSSSGSCCSRLRKQGCNASRITTGNTSRCLMVLLFLSAFIGGMGAAPAQQDESIATDVSVLCSECPAGTGVARLCTIKGQGANPFAAAQNVTEDQDEEEEEEEEEMATKCEPCVNGATFSDSASRHSPCRACRTCPAHSRVKRECNATHDTECECDRDHYQEISYQQQQQTVVTNDLVDQGVDESSGVAPTTTTPHARHRHGASIHQLQPQQQQQQPSEQQPVMSCKSCDLCPHGYGAARACSSTHNTICRKCPTSTYSSVLSATHGCSVCTVCRDDQVTLNECTPIQDTVCADKDMGHPSRRVITKPLDPVVHQQEEEYNNEGIISVYCAILGAIVLGLLIYVVMKQWRLRKAANKLAHFHDPARGHHGSSATVPLNGTAGGHHHHQHANNEFCGGSKSPTGGHKFECEISPSSSSRRLQQPALHGQGGSEGGSRGSRGSDSEFNAGIAAPGSDGYGRDLKPITQDTRLREICTAKRREMEAMLNARRDHHDWKALARDLGYTSTRIASFEQRAIEKQTGPTRHLFGDWAKREDSTVENLVSSLCNIGRHDVTLLLMPPFNQENHQLTTTNNTTSSSHPSRPAHTTSSLPRTTATTARCYKPISVV